MKYVNNPETRPRPKKPSRDVTLDMQENIKKENRGSRKGRTIAILIIITLSLSFLFLAVVYRVLNGL